VVCVGLIGLQLLGQANTRHISETFLCGFSIIGGMGVVLLWAVVTMLRLGIEIRNCAVAGEMIQARKVMKTQQQEREKVEREKRGGR
jgi:signal transduction histidine kinase